METSLHCAGLRSYLLDSYSLGRINLTSRKGAEMENSAIRGDFFTVRQFFRITFCYVSFQFVVVYCTSMIVYDVMRVVSSSPTAKMFG